MRRLLVDNKRGVSEMVSYVLLIIIAIGLSIVVFAYLRIYLPKEKALCDKDVSLAIEDYTCKIINGDDLELNLTLKNNGLFSVNAAYIRIDEPGKKVRTGLNSRDIYFKYKDSNGDLKPQALSPGKTYNRIYGDNTKSYSSGDYELEIQPAILSGKNGKELALCAEDTIVQRITCTVPLPAP